METLIITTLNHNIGDDFVREGILYLLAQTKTPGRLSFVHKHAPVGVAYGFEGIRNERLSRYLEPVVRKLFTQDRVAKAGMLIQSGAPVYWCHPGGPHCADNEWFDPIIRQRFLPRRNGRKLLNIAGGSCQRYHSDGSEIMSCAKCFSYIGEFFDASNLTLLRDSLARRMLQLTGRDAAVLPCTSIFARDQMKLGPAAGDYIVLNFMENGGHYTFGQRIDAARWRKHFVELADEAEKHGRVVIACHTPGEERLVKQIAPRFERFLVPGDHVKFMEFYAGAKFGIVNRVHAGFMMASFGKPAVVIGNDSRALMIENLNLKSIYVEDVAKVGAEAIVTEVAARTKTYSDEIEEIRRVSKTAYVIALQQAF